MAQTHATKGAILVLSVLSFGLLTGAMLLIGVSIVGFWKSLTPSEFVSWFASHSSRLGVIMIPLGAITVLVSLAAVAVSWRARSKQRQWTMIAALCALCVMVSYPVFFADANASFIAGGLSNSAVRALLDKWTLWHWGRTLLGLAGFVAATLALESQSEQPIRPPTIYYGRGQETLWQIQKSSYSTPLRSGSANNPSRTHGIRSLITPLTYHMKQLGICETDFVAEAYIDLLERNTT
jgi:hypothetical protein